MVHCGVHLSDILEHRYRVLKTAASFSRDGGNVERAATRSWRGRIHVIRSFLPTLFLTAASDLQRFFETMTLSSFVSSFFPVIYGDTPDEKPADEQAEQSDEPDSEEDSEAGKSEEVEEEEEEPQDVSVLSVLQLTTLQLFRSGSSSN
jgi:hypothetical protein